MSTVARKASDKGSDPCVSQCFPLYLANICLIKEERLTVLSNESQSHVASGCLKFLFSDRVTSLQTGVDL